jgi:hypothetical protein
MRVRRTIVDGKWAKRLGALADPGIEIATTRDRDLPIAGDLATPVRKIVSQMTLQDHDVCISGYIFVRWSVQRMAAAYENVTRPRAPCVWRR